MSKQIDVPPGQQAPLPQQHEALDSLGILIGETTHDFNNTLAQIFGYIEMALSDLPAGAAARTDLEQALAGAERAGELVTRMLVHCNRSTLKKEPVAVAKPVLEALKRIADRIPPQITLSSDITTDHCVVQGNETELSQIVMNLCNNSLQAMPAGVGRIEVRLELINTESRFCADHPALTPGNYALISVSDTGSGMNSSVMENMYTPFFSQSRGNNAQVPRAGLGLTAVNNIVASMSGFIFATSGPGTGSRFDICLPVLPASTTDTTRRPAANTARIAKRVLFIDDEPAITEMANHILTQSGYKSTLFIDGIDALRYFSEHPNDFDIIITDLKMPKISGDELAARCAAINPRVPIILTTGFSDKDSRISCPPAGVTTVISKPFSIGQLLSTLEELTK